jgi:hypothetical protein
VYGPGIAPYTGWCITIIETDRLGLLPALAEATLGWKPGEYTVEVRVPWPLEVVESATDRGEPAR